MCIRFIQKGVNIITSGSIIVTDFNEDKFLTYDSLEDFLLDWEF